MKRLITFLVAGPLLVVPLTAQAVKTPKPPTSSLTISAKPSPITFGETTTISGKLKGPVKAGVVTLQDNPAPYTRGYENVATTTTAKKGDYSFNGIRPTVNTRYRTTTPVLPATSSEILVLVRIRVTLHLSDLTPRAGQVVRFFGTAAPPHNGRRARIQRRTRAGTWKTIARPRLRSAGTKSRYSSRIRVRRDGVYRTRVYRDSDHATGTSGTQSVDVH